MFLGHFAVGFAAKPAAPRTSLGTLFLAAQFIDLLWPTFLLLGWERVRILHAAHPGPPLEFLSYPWSHSLALVLAWAALLGGLAWLIRRDGRSAGILGLLVLSHYLLDLVAHFPDLPLYPGGGPHLGLGLWGSPAASLALELGLFAAGLGVYLRSTRARDALGRWALVALAAFLLLIHLGNLSGPPPPSVAALAWVGQAQWLLVAWGYWVDRHRTART